MVLCAFIRVTLLLLPTRLAYSLARKVAPGLNRIFASLRVVFTFVKLPRSEFVSGPKSISFPISLRKRLPGTASLNSE